MGAAETRFPNDTTRSRVAQPPMQTFRLAHLRRLRGADQVAAVCYRINRGAVEFLLVETRSGRWTFPKGNAEPGLTTAQAAALEAFEEAGAHGRMEQRAFTQYVRRKGSGAEVVVHVHLCEVLRLGPPEEEGRHPTWFPAEKAKGKVSVDRNKNHGVELERVLELAVKRIEKLQAGC